MELKKVELNFGIKALEWLNEHYEKVEVGNGVEIGAAVIRISVDKVSGNLGSLVKLIHAGTLTEKKVLGIEEIEKELDKMDFEDIQELYDEVFTNFKNSAPVMYQTQKMEWTEIVEEATKA